jgi:hypothetical protein
MKCLKKKELGTSQTMRVKRKAVQLKTVLERPSLMLRITFQVTERRHYKHLLKVAQSSPELSSKKNEMKLRQ